MRFSLSPVTPVAGEDILSLSFAKAHLRVEHDFEDELIRVYRDGAVSAVEKETELSLAPREYVWRGRFGAGAHLGIRPDATIQSVTYLDSSGVEQSPPVIAVVRLGLNNALYPPVGKTWPETAEGDGVVEIIFTAGLAAGLCPPDLIDAALMALATLYMNREDVAVGVSVEAMPRGFVGKCAPYRIKPL